MEATIERPAAPATAAAPIRFDQERIVKMTVMATEYKLKNQTVDVAAIAHAVGMPEKRTYAKLREYKLVPRVEREQLPDDKKKLVADSLRDILGTFHQPSQRILATRYARTWLEGQLPKRPPTPKPAPAPAPAATVTPGDNEYA